MNKQQIEQLASQCVMCALCSETCPSYQIHQDENHSPRGRIALIRALANEQLSVDKHNAEHLDTCLQCFNCSSRCPSQVDYPQLIYYGNQLLRKHKQHKQSLPGCVVEKILSKNSLKIGLSSLISLLISLKIINFVRKAIPIRFFSLFPEKASNTKKITPSLSPDGIVLHSGCIEMLSPQTTQDILGLLNTLNIPVQMIESRCCGAMAKRKGNQDRMEHLLSQFSQIKSNIVSINSSCAAHLQLELSAETQDIADFLALSNITEYRFNPLKQKIFLHHSCSVKHRLKNKRTYEYLLKLIPELQLYQSDQASCCGAGGDFMFNYPEQSAQLATPLINYLIEQQIQLFVSSDISCALHIKSHLAMKGYELEVCHPISLLYRQLLIEE